MMCGSTAFALQKQNKLAFDCTIQFLENEAQNNRNNNLCNNDFHVKASQSAKK